MNTNENAGSQHPLVRNVRDLSIRVSFRVDQVVESDVAFLVLVKQAEHFAQLGAAGNSGAYGRISIGSQSFEGLQAQWDALDAGITGIASAVGGKSGFNLGGSNSGSDSGDSMQPFFEMGGPSSGSGSTQGSSTRHGENMHDATSHACAY